MFGRPSLRASVTTLAAAAVLVGGANLASYAASGHPLILGHANRAGGTTSLKNTGRGPALKLNSIRSAPPLVVNSSKMVRHLNANKVGGMTAAQLNPALLTYKVGTAGAPLPAGEHLLAVPSPKGLYRISVSGLWEASSSTNDITCLVVDQSVFTSGDITKVYLISVTSGADTNSNQILGSGFANLHPGATLVTGCDTTGNTGTDTLVQPITFTFEKVTQKVKQAPPVTIRNAQQRLLRR